MKQYKRKTAAFIVICVATAIALFAGDVANLVDLGFSNNGKIYAFGEYGMLDKNYRSYAEIYIVDVEKNEYVPGGVFKTSPTAVTAHKDSKSIFLSVQNRAMNALKKHNINEKNEGRPIYAQSEKTKDRSNFEFRDFETNYTYNVILHKKTKDLNAAFYISFSAIAPDGSKKTYRLGRENYFRPGVKDYNIKRVLINPENNALVFIIEKVLRDSSGDCIRYMVETITL